MDIDGGEVPQGQESVTTVAFERSDVIEPHPAPIAESQSLLVEPLHDEKKIEIIDQRLAGIEQLLRYLAVGDKNYKPPSQTHGSLSPSPSSNAFHPDALEQRDRPPLHASAIAPTAEPAAERGAESRTRKTPDAEFEGEPSMSAHSAHASELFENAVVKSPLAEHNPQMMDALSALKDIVERTKLSSSIHTLRFAGQKLQPTKVDLSKLEMPPVEAVLALLRKAKVESHPFFLLNLPFLHLSTITQLCKDLYFCPDETSTANFAIVNCILGYMFDEVQHFHPNSNSQSPPSGPHHPQHLQPPPPPPPPPLASFSSSAISQYTVTCRTNFETALSTFDLFLEPSYENIQALALGAFHATEASKPSLCWTFVSAAARMCQSLGYHHSVSGAGVSEEEQYRRRALFWFIYVLDKDLTLLLGRSSTLQDYDISLAYPGPPSDPKLRSWYQMFEGWVTYSTIAAQIYEKLYSALALSESSAMRTERACSLAMDVERWRATHISVQSDPAIPAHHACFFKYAVAMFDLSYYYLLTIIYRAKPPPQQVLAPRTTTTTTTTTTSTTRGPANQSQSTPRFAGTGLDPACVNAARNALRIHQQFIIDFRNDSEFLWKGYIVWSLLHCPFTPYLVIFTHTIATADLADLKLLEEVSASLESARHISEAAERLFKLCAVFYQVALLYVDVRMREWAQRGGAGAGAGANANANNAVAVAVTNSGVGIGAVVGEGGGGGHGMVGDPQQMEQQWGAGEVDSYLWELGFGVPAGRMLSMGSSNDLGIVAGSGGGDNDDGSVQAASSSSLQDWYRGNQYMMGLLESDL
ncbi:hypothetical protein ACO22_06617 [Paracoccidioides brasiliensis]|uniref:Xylanolytic transcriptional activator regulatory domain-containing protein n=1 Tax=Paracoccidioides brasiliensis TaxID=121759 RepID=A0A1D2J721_PARBR|nr:hypothetical protein ACO22_06617 [Paracoccidioides brasiliensis]